MQDRSKEKKAPIATLPMLNGKVYAIWSPALMQAALKSKELSFTPFVQQFAGRVLGVPKKDQHGILENEQFFVDFFQAIHVAMMPKHLHQMNAFALSYMADRLNAIESTATHIENLYLWLREVVTQATTEALYGRRNPLRGRQDLVDAAWVYEENQFLLLANFLPSLTCAKGVAARSKLREALIGFYAVDGAQDDPSISEIVRGRAAALLKYGMPKEKIGLWEIALLHVSTANTIPTAFWLITFVFSRPDILARVRDEVAAVVSFSERMGGKRTATIDISTLEARCPYTHACYREAIRVINVQTGNRRVMRDTVISDGERQYLLKGGHDVQFTALVPHHMHGIWGGDTFDFDPSRFYDVAPSTEKMRRPAYIPFGGGKHLCPGTYLRSFLLLLNSTCSPLPFCHPLSELGVRLVASAAGNRQYRWYLKRRILTLAI
jgi:hypothetical protein